MSLDVPLLEEDMPFFDEQDALLQNLQNALLKALNISDIPTQEAVKVDPPEYMLELYNRFATDKTSMPSANIVRSFKNEGKFWDPQRTKYVFQLLSANRHISGNYIMTRLYWWKRTIVTWVHSKEVFETQYQISEFPCVMMKCASDLSS